ncbi:TPA: hypothetical protein ACL1TL_006685, partial [Pseudomonas aeruginosa]
IDLMSIAYFFINTFHPYIWLDLLSLGSGGIETSLPATSSNWRRRIASTSTTTTARVVRAQWATI